VSTQIIYLEEDDDIASIRDRLDWVKEPIVLLILPVKGDLLTKYLDLALLQRHADALQLQAGLVTVDHRVSGQAKALGIPTFGSVRSASNSRRGWWRGRRRRETLGQPARLDEADNQEIVRRKRVKPLWQKWTTRYLALMLYLFTLAVLFIAAVYTIPGATITLKPKIRPLQVRRQIVADPALESVDASGASVPGRVLSSIQEWQAEVDTTGAVEVADAPAKGTVVFVNQLDQPVTVPTGSRVSTSAGEHTIFQTMSVVEVPGVVGGTVEVEVVAIEPGVEGNVRANRINRIEGPLAFQLEVRNLEATAGGGGRLENAVTESDVERLRSHVMQQLQVRALADMENQLAENEFLARDSLRVVRVIQETYSHFEEEQTDNLVLDIRAELQATAVDETKAIGLAYEELAAGVEDGYELIPESLQFEGGEVEGVDGQGRVTFEMYGEGMTAANLVLDDILTDIAGQKIGVAAAYMYESLPLQDYPSVHVWPGWFGRLPFLPVRMQTQIEFGS
jgi:hypothetical protein